MIEPAHLWIPPRVGSYGDEAIDLAEVAGRILDEEQRLGVDALLSYGPGGQWAALESGFIEARQNGKTAAVILPVVLFDLFLLEPDRIVWTAHQFRTARDSFDDICRCIETAPELSRRVKHISYSHGEESIELHSGAKLEFVARSSGGGRGLGGKRVVFDEALVLAAAPMGALLPTLSARPNPHVNYASSGAKETSEHLHSLIPRGRAKNDPSLIWVEYCAPGSWDDPPCERGTRCAHTVGSDGCALDNEEFWQLANHSLGNRITYVYVRAERRALAAAVREFGRERLGWHERLLANSGIDTALWGDLLDGRSERTGDVTVGVDIAPLRDYASIGLHGTREDGLGHLQLLDYRPGTEWIVERMVELRSLDPLAFAMGRATFESLKAELERAGFAKPEKSEEPKRGDLAVTTAAETTAATGQILDAVRQGTFKHIGQPELDMAVAGAKVKQVGDSLVWARKDAEADTSPLVAVTVARWGHLSRAHLIVDNHYDVLESIF